MMTDFSIDVRELNFSYGGPLILKDLKLKLGYGSRCLLVGSNGAGKSTLLRILAGKRLVKSDVLVMGRRAYEDTPEGISYLGPEWAANPIVRRDVPVRSLLKSMGSEKYPERCRKLIEVLDIDVSWHMHQVSDGERRRVQILLGLLQPFKILLLDEVTVDLDVVVRRNLLQYLMEETDKGATVIYATHIFDGLGDWPTHIAHISDGTIVSLNSFNNFPELEEQKSRSTFDSPLLLLVEKWLKNDFDTAQSRKRKLDGSKTHWDELSGDARKYGDKFYNYWE